LNLERIDLYVRYDQPLSRCELACFKSCVQRRLKREPVAYITGEKEFWSMSLSVSADVLIPRPETECLVEAALSYLSEPHCPVSPGGGRRVLELGTGSGAVILALAAHRPSEHYFATDCSIRAVKAAESNVRRHRLDGKVAFVVGDWFAPFRSLGPGFDMIVSNPPYIPTLDIPGLQPEISMYEPRLALDGGLDGLVCLRRIIGTAADHLRGGGILLLEIGHSQKRQIEEIVDANGGYEAVSFLKDYGGYHRVLRIRKKAND
jgi:release factor glutamine methyltransferase